MTTGKVVRAVIATVAIIAAIVVVRLRPAAETRPTSPVTVTASSSAPTTSIPEGALQADGRRGDEPWQRTARSFINRYPNTQGGKSAWLARLRPVVSDDLHRSLQTVHLANIPSGTFEPGQVQQTAEVGGVMRFPLRGGDVAAVDVSVSTSDQGRLRVTGFEPVTDGSVY
ncbi:hypothetical protein [Janibacter sp. LM]|uniref:hypothetical protein n=1 Tax=Janibacter sp. LM TaxID=3144845 RepID=UPI0031F618D2